MDITVTKNLNGSLTLASVVNGHRIQRVYFGYSLREAKRLFRKEV